jgi:hypothetical protein
LRLNYRLARVLKTHPDRSGLVRTVTVGFRRKNNREKSEVLKSKPLVEEQVSVQRLSLLVPSNEAVSEANKETVDEAVNETVKEVVDEDVKEQGDDVESNEIEE